jgi:hypothetical protein
MNNCDRLSDTIFNFSVPLLSILSVSHRKMIEEENENFSDIVNEDDYELMQSTIGM